MRGALTLFFLILIHVGSSAQNLQGIWRGYFETNHSSTGLLFSDQYKYELQFTDYTGLLNGVTYSYQDTRFYGKASMKGTYNTKTQKAIIREIRMLELKTSPGNDACIMTCVLRYSRSGNEEFLEGTYTSKNVTDSSDCGSGTVVLRKVPFSDFYKEPFLAKPKMDRNSAPDPRDRVKPGKTTPSSNTLLRKTAPVTSSRKPAVTTPKVAAAPKKTTAPKASPAPPVVKREPETKLPPISSMPTPFRADSQQKKTITPRVFTNETAGRKNILAGTLEIDAPEVTIKLYDNGVIDHDTISVYLNNKPLLIRKMLKAEPIVFTVSLEDPDAIQEIVMVADNLGDMPPNTALMVVEAGNFRKEVRLSSDMEKNAVVRFKRKSKVD